MTEMVDLVRRAVAEFGSRVDAVPADAWTNATPCTEWDVRAVVAHVVGELRWVPDMLAGKTIAEVGDTYEGDPLGDDPVAAWHSASDAAVAAFAEDGALDRTVHLSFGDTPSVVYCAQTAGDMTIHAWDVARGAGLDDKLDPELVSWIRKEIEPQAEGLAASGLFGTRVDVGPDADEQTQMLGIFGRRA
jgi:uncharacterized protein (TIGR03086 family)